MASEEAQDLEAYVARLAIGSCQVVSSEERAIHSVSVLLKFRLLFSEVTWENNIKRNAFEKQQCSAC